VAGHAIVAFQLGWRFQTLHSRHLGGLEDPGDNLQATIAYRLAGALAEARYRRMSAWKIFREEIGLGADGVLPDLDYLAEAMDIPSCDLTRKFIQPYLKPVERTIRARWLDIQALAEALTRPFPPIAP
jgi:hypothetical protein